MVEELKYQSMKVQSSGHMTHRGHFVSCFSTCARLHIFPNEKLISNNLRS